MNRTQRKYVPSIKRNELPLKEKDTNYNDEFEELLPPKSRRHPFKTNKPMTNRCCFFSPDCKDVELTTDDSGAYVDDHFNSLIKQQYDFDPAVPDTIRNLKELRKVLCGASKVDNCSQYGNEGESYIKTSDGSKWQSVDDTNNIEQYLISDKDNITSHVPISTNIRICETPHIKVIAEKFTKFKKNNVEVRKLEEKIVCVEYDIFEESSGDVMDQEKPIQKMRAYFSLKPTSDSGTFYNNSIKIHIVDHPLILTEMLWLIKMVARFFTLPNTIPSTIKNKYDIQEEDLKNLNQKEIEMIDSKIAENKPYLDDLKRVLKRKQALEFKKRKSNLDLMALYEMAKTDSLVLDKHFSTDLLNEKELNEIKDLIVKTSAKSVHGLSRRTIKQQMSDLKSNNNAASQSIIAELIG
ncbi:unnamed protein product, partial [Brenthis ino]